LPNTIGRELAPKYITSLIGRFYKILPLCESASPTLDKYMKSLLRELLGCKQLMADFQMDDRYTSLLCILQSLIDDHSEIEIVKADVFRAISLINQLSDTYMGGRV